MSAFGSFKFILSTKKKFEFLLLKNIIIIIYIVNIVFFAADRDAQQVVDHGLIGKLVKHGSHRVHTAVQDEQRSYNNADVNTTHIMHTRAHSPRSASRLALANGPPSTTTQRQHHTTTTTQQHHHNTARLTFAHLFETIAQRLRQLFGQRQFASFAFSITTITLPARVWVRTKWSNAVLTCIVHNEW